MRMRTDLRELRRALQILAPHPRTPTLVPHCTDEATKAQRGEGTGSGLDSEYFHHRDGEDDHKERESKVMEALHLSTSLEVTCPQVTWAIVWRPGASHRLCSLRVLRWAPWWLSEAARTGVECGVSALPFSAHAAGRGRGSFLSPRSETPGTEPSLSDPSCGCLGPAGRCWGWERGSGRADTAPQPRGDNFNLQPPD